MKEENQIMINNIFKEPLLHFLLLGAFLFIIFEYINPQKMQDDKTIYIKKSDIEYIKNHFTQRLNRKPTAKELEILIKDYITTEAYYKEAISLGLDKNDNIIKRHLRKKMEMMSKNVLSLIDITDEKLQKYLNQHKDEFFQDTVYVFDQVQIDPEKHAKNLKIYIDEVKNNLYNNIKVKSDSLIVPAHFSGISKGVLDGDFGKKFSKELDRAEIGIWSGPIYSNLGIHFVRVNKKLGGKNPSLANIKEQVTKSYIRAKQKDILKKQRQELLQKYKSKIDITTNTSDKNR